MIASLHENGKSDQQGNIQDTEKFSLENDYVFYGRDSGGIFGKKREH